MSAPPPLAPPPLPWVELRRRDEEQLKLLAIFYFSLGGLALIGTLLTPMQMSFMKGMLAHPEAFYPPGGSGAGPEVEQVRQMMAMMGKFFAVMMRFLVVMTFVNFVVGVAEIVAGICLLKKRHRTLCLIMAGITCASLPLGTGLGIWTFVMLGKPKFRAMLAEQEAGT